VSSLEKYLKILSTNPGGGGLTVESAVIWDTMLSGQVNRAIRGSLAEFGTFKGFGAALLCAYLVDRELAWLVDIANCEPEASSRIAEVGGSHVLANVKFVQMDSMRLRQTHNEAVGGNCRFIHIDGEHSYDAVINDLTVAESWLIPQGVIAVDDFFNPSCAAITQAVFDFCRTRNDIVMPFLIGYNKAYLCRSRYLGLYRRFCLELPDLLEARGIQCQLSTSGFALERTYFGIAPRVTEHKYQIIGRHVEDAATFNSALNDVW